VRALGCQPRGEGSRVRAAKTVSEEGGGVDPNHEERGKATEARSRFCDDADCTREDSPEIVQYQRAEPPGPLLQG